MEDSQKAAVELMLQQIENYIPIHQMHLDHDDNHIDRSAEEEDKLNNLFEQATMAIDWQIYKGISPSQAIASVMACEQFRNNKDLDKLISKKYSI